MKNGTNERMDGLQCFESWKNLPRIVLLNSTWPFEWCLSSNESLIENKS